MAHYHRTTAPYRPGEPLYKLCDCLMGNEAEKTPEARAAVRLEPWKRVMDDDNWRGLVRDVADLLRRQRKQDEQAFLDIIRICTNAKEGP